MTKYDAVEIGKRLKGLRGVRTRIGVARETQIPMTSLQAYEEGKRIPNPDRMIALANYYGTSVQHLFFEDW